MSLDPNLDFKLFNYTFYVYTTQFALTPLVGNNHSFDYNTMQPEKYCWYFIWLWFQVEVYKPVRK